MPGADEKYIVENFENAVKSGYIKPYFQPIVRTLTGDVCGAETLARWEDPKYGLLSPALFVDVLEKHGLISKLDMCIAESLCYGYNVLKSMGKEPIPFSINLSRIDFENGDIYDDVIELFKKYNVPPSAVCLEITESVTLDNTEAFHGIFDKFRKAGFEIWMDDFGSGYTSLNVLKDYEFDLLKIDMKFLSNINARTRKIISAIINMAKSIGVHTLAEGVETKEQVRFLRSVGCEMMQGYFFAKPMDHRKFENFLEKGRLGIEKPEERNYWQSIGLLNILSSDPFEEFESGKNLLDNVSQSSFPIEFLELRDERFYFLYRNDAYIKEAKKMGLNNPKYIDELVNDRTKPYYHDTKKQIEACLQTRGVIKRDYVMGEICYSYATKFIAATSKKILVASSLRVFGDDGIENRFEAINKYNRALFYNFELVNILHPNRDEAKQIYSSADFKKTYGTVSLRRGILEFAENEVHPADKQRYISFMDMDSLHKRFEGSDCEFVQQPFRLNTPDKTYRWRLVRLTLIPTLNDVTVMYSIQRMVPVDINAIEKLIAENPHMFDN